MHAIAKSLTDQYNFGSYDFSQKETPTMKYDTFVVIESTPIFHHSTDGYVGERQNPVAYCGTLDAAVKAQSRLHDEYYSVVDEEAMSWEDGPTYLIAGRYRNTTLMGNPVSYRYFHTQDLEVNSYYTGPATNDPWADVPF